MASEIRVNSLSSRTGLSTVTFTDTGPIFSGITTFQDNSGFNVGTGGSIFSPASNTVTLGTNNAERLRITSGGNVSIGSLTDDSIGSTTTLTIDRSSGNGQISFAANGTVRGRIFADNSTSDFRIGNPTSNDLMLYTNNLERLRITSAGLIGIGENNPSTPLHVAGSLTLENSSATGNAWTYYKNADRTWLVGVRGSSNDALSFYDLTTDVERLRITSDGTIRQSGSNSALGQGDSVAKLTQYTIDGTTPGGVGDVTTLETISATSNGSDYKFVITKREGSGGGSCFINLGGNSDGSISFGTNTSGSGTERLRITSAGNVGINEASNINGRLHVQHDALAENILYATRYNDQTNDKPIFAVTEALMSGMSSSGLVIGNHNRDIHIGPVFDNAAAVSTTLTSGIRITFDGKVAISDDFGSTLPSNFPASDVQLMVYTSTNGQPISNTNCARMLLATDAKQTGPQGYNGAIDFGNSDCTASGQNNQFNYRVASIMSQALADTESNAADGNLEFWTKTSSGSLSQKMGISAEGYVTKSNHPCFDAVRNSGHMSANVYINYNTVKANNGGHYNSSNGRFTAPVAGYYFFSWTSIKNNTNTVTRLYIHKNGNAAYGNRHLRLDGGQDYGDNGTMTAVIQLAENDYVQIYLGAGSIYGVTEEYCIFNGYLLG